MDYPAILEGRETRTISWAERDTILYGLSLGIGRDPSDERELRYVYEKGLVALPTQAAAMAQGAGSSLLSSLNYRQALDAGRRIELNGLLPVSGEFELSTVVIEAVDKGVEKGALVTRRTEIRTVGAEKAIASVLTSTFARGDGGTSAPKTSRLPPLQPPPDRTPDHLIKTETTSGQALLYRLNGDRNPLHVDPARARHAGFPRPILHGMCTFGIACHAIIRAMLDDRVDAVKSLGARFSAPVYPGDELLVRCWSEQSAIQFEVSVPERSGNVITAGYLELA
jgi:acyl dehydratase